MWHLWKFGAVPAHYWDNVDNRRQFFITMAEDCGFRDFGSSSYPSSSVFMQTHFHFRGLVPDRHNSDKEAWRIGSHQHLQLLSWICNLPFVSWYTSLFLSLDP